MPPEVPKKGKDGEVTVEIRYADVEKTIVGMPSAVIEELLVFFSSILPQVELAKRLSLSVDLHDLLATCEGVFAVSPEGVIAVCQLDALPDRELVLLHLVKAKIAWLVGKAQRDTILSADLPAATKRSRGTIAGRLSELCVEGLAEQVTKGEYRATTFGLDRFKNRIVPKLKKT